MSDPEDRFSPKMRCPRCMHEVPMKIVAHFSQVQTYYQEGPGSFNWDAGPIYQMLLCPACNDVSFAVIRYHDAFADEVTTDLLYPVPQETPAGLPTVVAKAYEAALRVRNVDANAFGVLLRRLLELVCANRNAKGRFLSEQLDDLAKRGEIPTQLADMAHRLRAFGNIGAHAAMGELRDDELPVLEKLCQAFLQYVYHGPNLLKEADQRLKDLKSKG